MAYDTELLERLRAVLAEQPDVTEKAMFGGVGFMVAGSGDGGTERSMAVAASSGGELMVRADPVDGEAWIDGESVRPMTMRGREMRGWLLVSLAAVESEADLRTWVDRGVTYARTL